MENPKSTVGTSEESCQGSVGSGSSRNGSNAVNVLVEQVEVSAERTLGCSRGSVSTMGVVEEDGDVKPIKEALRPCKRKCSWGLIWRRKKLDDSTCHDFVSRKVILKGNPDMGSVKPTCYYCCKPYDSDLMYIQCETCPNWYHADAVGLQEAKIFELGGFKCCKCRKTKKPACPYLTPEVKKLQGEAPKVKDMVVGSCPASVQEQQDSLPKSAEEKPHVEHDHPLPVSSLQVQPQPDNSGQQINHERDTVIDSGPQKLPVIRSVKQKKREARKR